jgi:hypothetical protein
MGTSNLFYSLLILEPIYCQLIVTVRCIQISSGKEISMNVKFLKTRLYGPTEANARFYKEIPDNREISYNFTVIV